MLLVILSLVCAVFFYCQAFSCGMGRKRWATAGLLFGPFIWPMFCIERRMQLRKQRARHHVVFGA